MEQQKQTDSDHTIQNVQNADTQTLIDRFKTLNVAEQGFGDAPEANPDELSDIRAELYQRGVDCQALENEVYEEWQHEGYDDYPETASEDFSQLDDEEAVKRYKEYERIQVCGQLSGQEHKDYDVLHVELRKRNIDVEAIEQQVYREELGS